jgi:hypothetical protein
MSQLNILLASMIHVVIRFVIFILTEAVRRNVSAVRAADASLEEDVQRWLRQAYDLNGGGQELYKKNQSGNVKGDGKTANRLTDTLEQLVSAAESSDES